MTHLEKEFAGFAAFIGLKFIGYSLAGIFLKWYYGRASKDKPHFLEVGFLRSAAGLIIGIPYGFFVSIFIGHTQAFRDPAFYFVFFFLLLPIRYGEWLFVIRRLLVPSFVAKRDLGAATCGVLISYGLDFIATFGLLIVSPLQGRWMC